MFLDLISANCISLSLFCSALSCINWLLAISASILSAALSKLTYVSYGFWPGLNWLSIDDFTAIL